MFISGYTIAIFKRIDSYYLFVLIRIVVMNTD